MFEFTHLGAETCRRIGGVAPHAAHGQAALPQVVGPGKEQRILTLPHGRRNRSQRQVVIAVGDHGLYAAGSRKPRQLRGKRNGQVGAGIPAGIDRALVLPDSVVVPQSRSLVVRIHRPGKSVSSLRIHRQRPAKDGTSVGAGAAELVGAVCRRQFGAGLSRHARPCHPVRRLVIPVIAHRREKQLPHRVPHHRGRGISIGARKRIDGPLHWLSAAVRDGGQVPGSSAIGGVIQALVAHVGPVRIHQRAFVGL